MAGQSRQVMARINATKKTAQITKAMNMVSASRLRIAEKTIKEYRPFIEKARDIIANLSNADESKVHPLLAKRDIKKVCFVVVASDRGLAGPFNSNVCKELTKQINEINCEYTVLPIGLKAYTYALKMKYPMLVNRVINIKDDIEFSMVEDVIKQLVTNYLDHAFDQVIVIYNHYVNTLIQKVVIETVLPVENIQGKESRKVYEFDGGVKEILDTALPIYIENTIYGYFLDSKASEHASRMNSMKSATDNAMEVISSLQLLYNRARQAAITLELTDIVGGASVVNE
jgi:F-type H+-transporting ATPase subunit gamma